MFASVRFDGMRYYECHVVWVGTCVALCVVWVCDFFILFFYFHISHELWQIKVSVGIVTNLISFVILWNVVPICCSLLLCWFIYKFDIEFEWVFRWCWDSKFYWKLIGNEKLIIITFKTLFKMLFFIGYNVNSFQIKKLRKQFFYYICIACLFFFAYL